MKRLLGILSFWIILIPLVGQVQQDHFVMSSDLPQEYVLLSSDRDLYLAGEDMFFSASILLEDQKVSESPSNILYVELYKGDYTNVIKQKYQIIDGQVNGVFPIPAVIISDHYYLRAYTQYMRNFPPEIFYNKRLSILNPDIPAQLWENRSAQINLWPENGQIIEGVQGRMVLNTDRRLLADVDYYMVSDNHNRIISKGDVLDNGLAIFDFEAVDSLTYKLFLVLKNGDSLQKDFPMTKKEGLFMTTVYTEFGRDVRISSQGPKHLAKTYTLKILTPSFCTSYEQKLKLSNDAYDLHIDQKFFKSGINYMLLMDDKDEIIQIHPVYHHNLAVAEIPMNVPAQFHIRDRVELATSDWPDHTTVAVIKSGTQAISGAGGLLPNYIIHNPYLLKNYLVFPVENNAILASQIEASLIINHDLFNSNRMKEKLDNACQQKLKWLPETRDVSLGGILINKETKEPVRDAKVFAAVLGQIPQLHSYTTEADGQFYFSLNHLNDFKDVCICTASKPEKIELLVYNDFSTTYAAINHIPLLVDSSLIELAKEMWVNKQTGKVFSEKNAIQLIHKDSLEFPFTNPHISKRLRDYIPMPTLFEVFNEIIPFVEVKKRKDHYSLSILSEDKKLSYNDPLVLVDNLPIFNMDELMEIHPAKIEQIDVYNADYTYGDLIIKGIVIIETNTEDFGGISPPENAVFIEYQTLSPNVEMSFPDYSGSMKQNRLPDFRNVLYWNPDATSNDTNSSLLFFAGDRRGDYEVIIKGHGKNGQLYYGKQAIDID